MPHYTLGAWDIEQSLGERLATFQPLQALGSVSNGQKCEGSDSWSEVDQYGVCRACGPVLPAVGRVRACMLGDRACMGHVTRAWVAIGRGMGVRGRTRAGTCGHGTR